MRISRASAKLQGRGSNLLIRNCPSLNAGRREPAYSFPNGSEGAITTCYVPINVPLLVESFPRHFCPDARTRIGGPQSQADPRYRASASPFRRTCQKVTFRPEGPTATSRAASAPGLRCQSSQRPEGGARDRNRKSFLAFTTSAVSPTPPSIAPHGASDTPGTSSDPHKPKTATTSKTSPRSVEESQSPLTADRCF
jgi:hypothetical protein